MKVFIEKQNKEKQITFDGTPKKLLEKLKINKETVIVVRMTEKGQEIVTDSDKLSNKDTVRILSVISGG